MLVALLTRIRNAGNCVEVMAESSRVMNVDRKSVYFYNEITNQR